MRRSVGRLVAALAVTAAVASSPTLPDRAGAAAATGPGRCLSDNGTDVQRYFGVRADVVWLNLQGLQPPCDTVVEGRPFVRAHGWITQVRDRATYPADYVPARRAPMADFLAKLTQARYVVLDAGGEVALTRTVGRSALLGNARLGRFGDLFVAPDTTLVPGLTILARSPEWTSLERLDAGGLDPGDYTIEVHWTLAARHCDGFAPDPVTNCLPAGESLTSSAAFTVVPRR
jgi:hypothetical protein